MKNDKIIFIGPAGGGDVPTNGASVKNYHLIRFFKEKAGKKIRFFFLNLC